jgi:hypothetical protein
MATPTKSATDSAAVTATVTAAETGSVRLRGLMVALDTVVGAAFIADCARHTEGLLSDDEIKDKWTLSDEDWAGLAANTPLLKAVQAERQRRIHSGDAPREAAQWHFAKAPTVLGTILTDELVSPRHRIEAAKELRQVAGNGPEAASGPKEPFVITINLGGDEKLVFEKELAPRSPSPPDDGELP